MYKIFIISHYLCLAVKKSALLMSSKLFLFGSTSLTYFSKSALRKRSGLRASTICTTSCERSMTRHSCRHTSMFFSKGVSSNPWSSSNLHWPVSLHKTKKAIFSVFSVLSHAASPFQKTLSFVSLHLLGCHGFIPRGSSRYSQLFQILLMFLYRRFFFLFRQQERIVVSVLNHPDVQTF